MSNPSALGLPTMVCHLTPYGGEGGGKPTGYAGSPQFAADGGKPANPIDAVDCQESTGLGLPLVPVCHSCGRGEPGGELDFELAGDASKAIVAQSPRADWTPVILLAQRLDLTGFELELISELNRNEWRNKRSPGGWLKAKLLHNRRRLAVREWRRQRREVSID